MEVDVVTARISRSTFPLDPPLPFLATVRCPFFFTQPLYVIDSSHFPRMSPKRLRKRSGT